MSQQVVSGPSALLVIDVQNGFIGQTLVADELPVPGGEDVVPLINALMAHFEKTQSTVIASQDWHPPHHGSFASQNPGRHPFELGTLGGRPQVLWPNHCVQGTPGAAFHPALKTEHFQAIIRKGMDPGVDSYSVFYDNHRHNPSGLVGMLKDRGITSIFVCGLAFDYCVRYSALDALEVTPDVRVIVDACRSVAPESEVEARAELLARGVKLVLSGDVLKG